MPVPTPGRAATSKRSTSGKSRLNLAISASDASWRIKAVQIGSSPNHCLINDNSKSVRSGPCPEPRREARYRPRRPPRAIEVVRLHPATTVFNPATHRAVLAHEARLPAEINAAEGQNDEQSPQAICKPSRPDFLLLSHIPISNEESGVFDTAARSEVAKPASRCTARSGRNLLQPVINIHHLLQHLVHDRAVGDAGGQAVDGGHAAFDVRRVAHVGHRFL